MDSHAEEDARELAATVRILTRFFDGVGGIHDALKAALLAVVIKTIDDPYSHDDMKEVVWGLSKEYEIPAAVLFGIITDSLIVCEFEIEKEKARQLH